MDYYEDTKTLMHLIHSKNKPNVFLDFIKIIHGLAKLYNKLHNIGIIHGDIKPDNVLYTIDQNGDYTFWLIDFGLSFIKEQEQIMYAGTHGFRAPELFNQEQKIDKQIDLYAFGRLINEMVNGKNCHCEYHNK